MGFRFIDDYLLETAPDEDLDSALAALHEEIVAASIPLIGYPRTWDRAGRQIESGTRPELISALIMPFLKFDLLPGDWDIVVIGRDQCFDENTYRGGIIWVKEEDYEKNRNRYGGHVIGDVNRYGGGITWVKDGDYRETWVKEKPGPAPIEGWGELLIDDKRGDKPRQIFKRWVSEKYPNPQVRPGPTKLVYDFTNETGIVISLSTARRALGLKN